MYNYGKANETVHGTGMEFVCEADGVWAYDLGIPFKGSCEIEIDKVTCWLGEKYSNLLKVELIAKNVNVEKFLIGKCKYAWRNGLYSTKFYAPIKMLTLRDLETYSEVKDYMEENDISIKELIESLDC